MRETGRSGVAAYLVKIVKERGGIARKIKFEGRSGCPDYLVGLWGRAYLIETKRPGKKPTPAQVRAHGELRRSAGVPVICLNTKEAIDKFF